MPIAHLTGTSSDRIQEIESSWVNFEPISDSRIYQDHLYTVPLGQTYGAEVVMHTGSFVFSENGLNIKKEIHVFEDEVESDKFIAEMGHSNIISIIRIPSQRPNGSKFLKTEVHLINYPEARFDFDLLHTNLERGFKLEMFASGSNGLYEVEKAAIFNAKGELISDTFLKYFEVHLDD
jgi:hypothetical protein